LRLAGEMFGRKPHSPPPPCYLRLAGEMFGRAFSNEI
jgi:hypothetical protein